jgi:hypothetical protein
VVLGYKAFFSAGTTPAVVTTAGGSSAILPKGDNLDFSQVKKYNKDGRIFQYPVVSPSEIGPDVNAIIKQ